MVKMFKFISWAVILPIVLIIIVYLVDSSYLIGTNPFDASMAWSIFGGIAGYVGVVFSFYAALGVSQISNKYFAKSRLPDIHNKILGITKRLVDHAESSMSDLRASQVVPEVGVVLRSVKRVQIKNLQLISKSVESKYKKVKINMDELSTKMTPSTSVNQDDDFWALVSSLSELADEIETYQKEEDARI
ncbi:hypothetical protein [Celeribacter halophilus]|uniref:hypothetical protein n=1 Tax=Celeribacter halophilus TaxID=576117 RepID=UPI001C09BB64|nr:hypothetical protein [Celeribacter halophilus]MBU2889145.1 hypothetical protein [Celeribacter halophilus]MDO6510328.1 hypothetical protein [Celeribacter halophilus]